MLEALGIGMDFRDGDLAYRVNFATCGLAGDRRPPRRPRPLVGRSARPRRTRSTRRSSCRARPSTLQATVEHRGALVIRADDGSLSADVTNTDPAYRKEGTLGVALETFEPVVAHCEPLDDTDAAHRAADLTNAFVEGSAQDPGRLGGERRAPRGAGSSPRT